ncbi:MAG: T9SS type A sorting domain-containing protein [Saprospiraceae bacterium]|nr:T9SS type A sorting domain-containing protein [Saprospiraceae bacterium]
MYKGIFLIIAVLLSSMTSSHAQCQANNGDFETWIDLTDSIEFELALELTEPVLLPEGWFPLFRLVDIAFSQFIVDYFDADSLDLDIFGGISQYAPGANGSDFALRIAGDSLILDSDLLQIFQCSGRPARLTGQYKFVGEAPDSLRIAALLHNSNVKDEEVAMGVATFISEGGPSEFTSFSVDFDYKGSELADSATIIILASKDAANRNDTSYFVVDELEIEGGMVPTTDFAVYNSDLIFPNPVRDHLFLAPRQESAAYLEIYDLMGRKVFSLPSPGETAINVTELPSGLYIAKVKVGEKVFSQRIRINK